MILRYYDIPILRGELSFFIHVLDQSSSLNQVVGDGVKHTVDVTATPWGGVYFGNLHELIDGYGDRDAGECHHLSNGYLHDDDIHIGKTGEIPIAGSLRHVSLIFVSIHNGGAEQLLRVILVIVITVFGQQALA